MKKLYFIIILLLCFSKYGKAIELSDSLRISILTVSPGNELYSTFGHTAVRVTDLKQGYDIVFNYGTFDFRTPNFYVKFALGQLDYLLSAESFDRFIESSVEENRSVVEQKLNLPKAENVRLAMLLIKNYQPENRAYRYKFFTDNCSTRVRDILAEATSKNDLLMHADIQAKISFRTMYTSYLKTMPWSRFGTELLLGSMTDNVAGYDALFLPDNLKAAIDKADLNGHKIVAIENKLFTSTPISQSYQWFSPMVMGLFVILISFFIQTLKGWTLWFDRIFFSLLGLLGLFIAAMSLFSHHHEVQTNWVVLFILPTLILFPFCIGLKLRQAYSKFSFLILLLAFLCLPIIPQTFNPALLLLSFATAVRLYFNFEGKISLRNFKKK